ncbi:MAG TPA: hypothetical protein VN325_39085 [Steroidobacteraceae bacterium]|nr:hypothetical protein [Steroidobacteraceae bacterium]
MLDRILRTLALNCAVLLSACGGGGGAAAPQPTVTITSSAANVAANNMATLTWSSTNATACTASGGWTGALAASGSQSVKVAQTSTYSLSCTGSGGSGTGSVVVTAYSAPLPTITVDNATLLANNSVLVTWASQNATACSTTGGSFTSSALSGTHTVGPLTATTTFTISCTNPVFATAVTASATTTVSTTASLTVNVLAQLPGSPIVDAAGRYYVPDWANPVTVAVPFVYVELDDANQHVVQRGYADANGTAVFPGLDPTASYSVMIQSKISSTTPLALDFEVVNNNAPISTALTTFRTRYGVYAASLPSFSPGASKVASQTVALTAPDGWDTNSGTLVAANRAAGPFALLASAVLEAQIVSAATGSANPTWRPLTILWSVANKGGLIAPPNNYDQGTVTGSGGFWSNSHYAISATGTDTGASSVLEDFIYLSGDPTFEAMDFYPTVMTHEMGHFVQSLFSTDASPGGSHAYTDYQDATLSWIEGNASGISALVMDSPQQRRVVTNNGEIVVEIEDISQNTVNGNPQTWPVGWFQESTVTNFMWTAHSSMGLTTAQTLAPMFSAPWKAGPYLDTIWSYATILKQQNPAVAASIDSFSSAHNFVTVGNDEYGSKETNLGNRAAKDVLPPSTTLTVGQTVSICSVGALLEYNKEGNARMLKIVGDGISHTLTIQGPANTVPVLGRNVANVTSGSSTFTLQGSLPATGSTYTVGECGVVAGEFSTETTGCGDPNPPAEQCWSVSYQ